MKVVSENDSDISTDVEEQPRPPKKRGRVLTRTETYIPACFGTLGESGEDNELDEDDKPDEDSSTEIEEQHPKKKVKALTRDSINATRRETAKDAQSKPQEDKSQEGQEVTKGGKKVCLFRESSRHTDSASDKGHMTNVDKRVGSEAAKQRYALARPQ